jgi:hypothetical protein
MDFFSEEVSEMCECPKCRMVFERQVKFCERCGYQFTGHDHRRSSPLGTIVLVTVGAVLAMAVIVATFGGKRDVEAKPIARDRAAPVEQKPTVPEPQWTYDQTTDEMGRERYFATVRSTNTVNFEFPYGGEQHATLMLRSNRTDFKDVIFRIERGQFVGCEIEQCTLNVRFDQGPIRQFYALGTADHDSRIVFIQDVEDFMAAMRKAKVVHIEATFYQEGRRIFEFPVAGFKW